jgi:arylsulfatase A-like enzyme
VGTVPYRFVSRALLCFFAMSFVAAAAELWRAWPSESAGGGFALMLAVQVIALTAVWTLPFAVLVIGAGAAWRALRPGQRDAADLRWLAFVPPAAFTCVTAGQALHAWSAGAFVRQDLAGAVVPALQLAAFAAIGGAAAVGYRYAREPLGRLPAWSHVAMFAGGALVFGAIHIARFPALLDDAKVPMALQILVVLGAGIAIAIAPDRWLVWRPRWIAAGIAGATIVGLFIVMLLGGRLAPLSYPVAAAALQSRGMMAARVAGITAHIGDGDGDGFSRYFGGLDCDDGDAEINPLAKDVPDNGVDEDCFEGDLAAADVEADRAAHATRNGRAPRQRARNVILITVDALRADAVGFGGAKRPTTPTLDALAVRGAVFERAYSQAPMTRKAFPALLAGRYPANIHWLDLQTRYPYPVSHADNLYLAEAVAAAGVRTGSVVAFNYARNSRFDQGFEDTKIHPASKFKNEINANRIVADAETMLRGWAADPAKPRFFLWLHLYEAHFPYVEHEQFGFGSGDFDRYLSEVRWIDSQLARLFATLDQLGVAGDTAIVFTGDHGEEFGEHGGEHHGELYVEDLHVPLLIAGAGATARRFDTPVGLIDIAPTVLELMGIPIPDTMDGDSLVGWIEGDAPPAAGERFVYAELVPDKKVPRRVMTYIGSRWQLIVDFQIGARELFDLEADPKGQRNVLVDAPAVAARMEQRLRRHVALRVGPVRVSVAESGEE